MKRVIANDLSKLYVHGESSTISLQHAFTQAWRKWSGKAWEEKISKIPEQRRGPRPGTFWAIQDVSLEIGMGETVGLLGPNGAGKSTLVRVLGRLTEPSSGKAVIEGRVASVLEVGAGFHPDLTGRENALLNGALLGMRRKRLEEKMDSILAFAGVEAYADTAVKYYSSGMQYRLAVSVALHLEADFLMLDEVLEVADLEFEDRCQKRMAEMQALGHSFLFVTHNRTQLEKFCSRLYWMEQGRVRTSGNTKDVLAEYQQETRR